MKKYERRMLVWAAFCGLALLPICGFGEEEKTVLATSDENGFRLSEKAQKTLGLGFLRLEGAAPWKIPSGSLVVFQDRIGVYRLRDGSFKLVEVEVTDRSASGITVRCPDLKSSDQIVVEGAAHLRVADLGASEEFQEEHVD